MRLRFRLFCMFELCRIWRIVRYEEKRRRNELYRRVLMNCLKIATYREVFLGRMLDEWGLMMDKESALGQANRMLVMASIFLAMLMLLNLMTGEWLVLTQLIPLAVGARVFWRKNNVLYVIMQADVMATERLEQRRKFGLEE